MIRNRYIEIVFLFIFLQSQTSALIFNEIMYDPDGADTDREWIELLNERNDTVDLTGWKFFEANVNHGLTVSQGAMLIPIGGYAIISNNPSKFLQDNPTFQGTLIKSSFSLSNSGEYLAMKNPSGAIQDSLTYIPSLGGQDDGSTLSYIGGAWVRGDKTPSATNIFSTVVVTPTSSNTTQNTTNTTSNNQTNNNQVVTIAPATITSSDLAVNTVNEKVVIAGADAEFVARASIAGKKVADDAQFTWSFGDGGSRTGRSVGYHYQYPGMYVATVEVSAEGSIATSKTRVKVIDPEISISAVGGEPGKNFIEISNTSNYEMDISNWKIALNRVMYSLPKNTFIMRKQKVRFAGTALGFASTTINSSTLIQLMYPNYTEMLRYTATTTTLETPQIKNEVVSIPQKAPQIQQISQKIVYKKQIKETTTSTSSGIEKPKEEIKTSWFKRFLSKL